MIFVTTGTQAPFNRLVKAMNILAAELEGEEIIVQASGVDFATEKLKIVTFLNPNEYDRIFNEARLIVSHAGMGSIISALTIGKPIIIIPRRAALGEHRNDHQLEGAKKMESLGYFHVAYSEEELNLKIKDLLSIDEKESLTIGRFASNSLVDSVRNFIIND